MHQEIVYLNNSLDAPTNLTDQILFVYNMQLWELVKENNIKKQLI